MVVAGLVAPQSASAGDFTLAAAPGAIAWSPDGQYAYFSPSTWDHPRGHIKRLDLSNGTVTDIVTMTDPGGCHAHVTALAVTPDNTTLVAGGYSCVFTIPLANPSGYTSTYTGFDWATRVVAGEDAAFAVGSRHGLVYKLTKSGATWGPTWSFLRQDTSATSRWLTLSQDQAMVYVGKEDGDASAVNTSTGAATVLTGSGPSFALAVAPDSSFLLVTNGQRTVKKVMLTDPTTPGTITSSNYGDEWGMRQIVMDPTGTYAFIGSVWSKSIVKIRTSDLTVVDRILLTQAYPSLTSDAPNDLAASPSSSRPDAANELLVSIGAISTMLQLPTAPYAPSSLSALPGDDSATVSFTPPASGMATITNYEYRVGGSGSWTALSPADTTSPVTVPGLTNGTPASIELRAVNAKGSGAASSSVTVTPQSTPRAPRNVSGTPASEQLTINFTAPESDGGFPITNYEVSTDNGTTWTTQNPPVTSGPITVGGLTNGVQYLVSLRAINALGTGTASAAVGMTPNVASSGSGSSGSSPEPTPSPSPSATAAPDEAGPAEAAPPPQITLSERPAVGEGLVVVDGRATRVAVKSVNGRAWQVQGEDFTLEFIPQARLGDLDGSFTARAGTKVLVRGDGFAPGTLIASYLPGAWADSLGQSRVQDDGSFEVVATIPSALKSGQYVFQVNGLSSQTSVRSVNLGMRLLPAMRTASRAQSMRVSFAPRASTVTDQSAKDLAKFVRTNARSTDSALIVPTVSSDASPRDVALARSRALELKKVLRAQGFTDPIRVATKVRRADDVSAQTRTTLWLRN